MESPKRYIEIFQHHKKTADMYKKICEDIWNSFEKKLNNTVISCSPTSVKNLLKKHGFGDTKNHVFYICTEEDLDEIVFKEKKSLIIVSYPNITSSEGYRDIKTRCYGLISQKDLDGINLTRDCDGSYFECTLNIIDFIKTIEIDHYANGECGIGCRYRIYLDVSKILKIYKSQLNEK